MTFSFLCFSVRFRDLAAKSKENLVALGFPQFTVEDFHDTVSITGGCHDGGGGSSGGIDDDDVEDDDDDDDS